MFNKIAAPLFTPLEIGAAMASGSVVVTVGRDIDPASVVGLPSNVSVHQYVPLDALLAHCEAVIEHAGWGRLIACANAAVPIGGLVLGADQAYNAAIAERQAFSVTVMPADCSPDHVAATTQQLLTDNALRVGARREADRLSELPSPNEAAEAIHERIASHP